MYAGSIRGRQAATSSKSGSSKRQGLLALAAVALVVGAIVGIRQEWTFTAHLTDEATAIHHAEAHHAEVVHLTPVPDEERRIAAEVSGGQAPAQHMTSSPDELPAPIGGAPVDDAPIDQAPAAVTSHPEAQEQHHQQQQPEPTPTPKPVVAPHPAAVGTTDPDGGAAAAFARMEEVAKATIKINRDPSKPDPREVSRREEKIREEQEATRQRIAEVHTRVEEAAAQQEKAERERKPEDLVMPQVAIGPDGIPIPPKPHPLFAPVEILSIASTPEIKDAIKRANERADSVGANLVGRDTWDLSGLHPRVMLEGSNAIPGQKNRAIVVTFTDFRPDGNEKNQKQAAMVINWVRWMKRHRIHCLVAVCQKELSIKNAWVLLEEGWCVPFLATEKWAMENPKVGRWWYVQEMLKEGYDVLSSDADVAWMRDPRPYFGKLIGLHPKADVFTSTDSNDGVYSYAPIRRVGEAPHQRAIVPLDEAEKKLPLPEAKFKRTLGKSLPYSEGFVHKPEMEGKDSSNRIREVVEILAKGEHDAGLENPQDCGAQWNTGVMYWRATPRAIKLLDYAKEVMAADPMHPNEPMKRDDQKPINAALRVSSEACPWSEETKGPTPENRICGDDMQLHAVSSNTGCLGVLPVAQFSNGFTYTVARLHEQFRVRPFSFHATYASDKVLKLREEGVWLENPSRYNGMKLLWYEPKMPRELFPFDTGAGVSDKYLGQVTPWHHAALIQYQLKQLRAAMAVAHVLKRTIVLPHFACLCECFYYRGLNCTIEGHRLHLPYICPTDHVLWGGGKGLKVPFVEPGFMDAPDLPHWFTNSSSRVHLCDKPGCADNDQSHKSFFKPIQNWRELRTPQSIAAHEGPRMVYPPAPKDVRSPDLLVLEQSNDEEIFHSLGKYHDVHILQLNDPIRTWGGFIREEDETHFRSLVGEALGRWCCWGLENRGVQFQYELKPGEEEHAQYLLSYEWDGLSRVLPLGGDPQGTRTCNA